MLSILRQLFAWPLVLGLTVWGAAALYFCAPGPVVLHSVLAGAYVVGMLVLFIYPNSRIWRWLGVLALFSGVLAWWLAIPPSNNRDWQPDVMTLPTALIDGDQVTVRNIRNCDYQSETNFTVRYYDATFDLSQLRTVDLFLCYWGSPSIAHTMMSFGFTDGRHLCVSIETRKEKGENYSAIAGFFKQYELTYIVADERDVVRLRTNFRHEDVYCYRLKCSPTMRREVLLSYLKTVNEFHDRPEWYNAATDNCTTSIRGHTQPYGHGRWDWRILVNGYLDEMLYERGVVDRHLSFTALKELSLVNQRAEKAGDAPDFSQQIRQGLPAAPE